MQKSKQVFSVGQQTKFQQLQLEVAALEQQVVDALQQQLQITNDRGQAAIPLLYVDDRVAKSGIRPTHETA